jgi:hypothetical protein
MKLHGTFEVTGWNEEAYREEAGEKLTRASVTQRFSGTVEGQGSVEWLMCYRPDATAHFVGLQRIEGRVDGKLGAITLETVGDFDGEKATGDWRVVPGAGTGAFEHATGKGHFTAPMGPAATFDLQLRFLQPAHAGN